MKNYKIKLMAPSFIGLKCSLLEITNILIMTMTRGENCFSKYPFDCIGLGMDDVSFFVDRHRLLGDDGNPTLMRSLYYPEIDAGADLVGQERCGEHSDFGCLNCLRTTWSLKLKFYKLICFVHIKQYI